MTRRNRPLRPFTLRALPGPTHALAGALVIALLLALPTRAESPGAPGPGPGAGGTPEGRPPSSERGPSPGATPARYPRIVSPPGFYEGALFLGGAAGKTAAPGGSYVTLEKYYDQRLREGLLTGTVRSVATGPDGTPLTFESEYLPGTFRSLDIEYGAFEHFGLGLSLFSYSIDVLRQDLFPPVGVFRNVAEPLPRRRRLYEGTAANFLATYHPVSRSFLDPFVALRAGFVGYSGEAHAGVGGTSTRLTNRVRNGVGGVYGAGVGMNLHLGRSMGIRVEGSYTRQILKSDLFSSRDLSAYHATIGVFFNYSAIAAGLE